MDWLRAAAAGGKVKAGCMDAAVRAAVLGAADKAAEVREAGVSLAKELLEVGVPMHRMPDRDQANSLRMPKRISILFWCGSVKCIAGHWHCGRQPPRLPAQRATLAIPLPNHFPRARRSVCHLKADNAEQQARLAIVANS
jgi:hypothetical protein